MKPPFLLRVIALFALTTSLLAGPRDAQWKKVEDARQKGLPKTAIEELEPIIADCLADKSYPEAIKAIGKKIALEGNIQGNKPEECVVRLQAELGKAPPEMKPAMEAILAHWYWQYFQQNRWRFLQRTQTAEAPGPDIQTWDLARILAEIDRHFIAALADDKVLKSTPVTDYNDLLQNGNVPDEYRPTMFDVLSYDALQFYQTGEHAAIKAEDNFELDAAGPIFADVAEFAQWQPATTDETSPILKAIRLYQNLLHFHQADADRSAFYDADLARLVFGYNFAVGDYKTDRYKSSLGRIIAQTENLEVSARARSCLASLFQSEGNLTEAHAIAQRGFDAFPDTAGGAMCFNLLQQIEAKSAQLSTEFVWNTARPKLDVTYRNVTKVYFRAVRVDFEEFLRNSNFDVSHVDRVLSFNFLATKPLREWVEDLPPTTDFQTHTASLTAPTDLSPGFYCLIASHLPDFGRTDNQLSLATVWVSNLALITEDRQKTGTQGGFVLEAGSGEPVAGAKVRMFNRQGNVWTQLVPTPLTDENGHFSITKQPGQLKIPAPADQFIFVADYHDQAISNLGSLYQYKAEPSETEYLQAVFFTDRAIYRPGQIISYKGIAYRANEQDGSRSVLAREKVVVIFADANENEIARATHQTNAFGSFSGTFTAPRDRNTGVMSIRVDEGPEGGTRIRVEEYKRPKFQVELPAPQEAAKLNSPVHLSGKATAYTDAAIGGAKVKWRVERAARLPAWCWWWQPPATTAIAHGTAITNTDGSFSVDFNAASDRSVPEKLEPVFNYQVSVDVTDTTGETRSAHLQMLAGYTALQASLFAVDWQTPDKPVELAISTSTLDGVPQSVSGSLTISALTEPAKVERAPLQGSPTQWYHAVRPSVDPANPDSWESGDTVAHQSFKSNEKGTCSLAIPLSAGIYRASLETKDRFGKVVTARHTIHVVDPYAKRCPTKLASFFEVEKPSVEPGDSLNAVWGTGYNSGRAFVVLESDGEVINSYWTAPNQTQEHIELPITEELHQGVTIHVMQVRENRAYLYSEFVGLAASDRKLNLEWERFRSKLLPGQKETWTLKISDIRGEYRSTELAATLYDASLDQFARLNWPDTFEVPSESGPAGSRQFHNARTNFNNYENSWRVISRPVHWMHRMFNPSIFNSWWWPQPAASADIGDVLMYDDQGEYLRLSPFCVEATEDAGYSAVSTLAGTRLRTELKDVASAISRRGRDYLSHADNIADVPSGVPDLQHITARKNLRETAFFFPHLRTNWRGKVKLQFTMPETLTQWRFLAFAHDKQLRSGLLTDSAVTAKDLMVEPNPPRFVREGDAIEFTVKVSNESDQPQTGKVRLTFADAASLKSVDETLGNRATEQSFEVPAKQSRSYAWRIAIPDGMGFITYKAVGATKSVSDGEEGFLPVLSRRTLVTESLPLPIRGKTTKQFEFKKLLDSGKSDTLRQESLTVQMVSQPAWYAVMALPYLMEYPYECSEQLFNRLYANVLARHLANSDPKIRRTFDLWKNTPALDSPLTKNQDLKSVMLEETPWLRQANAESQSRRNIGLLFDANRLDEETGRTLSQLSERQLSDGLWSWFPGGRSSEYISLYITTGFGRLRHLGADIDVAPAIKSLGALDAWMDRNYREIRKRPHSEDYVPDHLEAIYLYARSFFLKDRPIATEHWEAVDFFLSQSRKFWLRMDCRMCQAQLAIALQRFGDTETPQAIMKSLKERSVTTEEMGMFWRNAELSWWWYQAPIETQAMMIEAFDEVAHDAQAVEGCKVWLLKQKQTQDWKTTKATADAIYGLLLHGDNLLASDALVEVALGGEPIKPEKVEAGTGFYEQKFVRGEIKPAMGQITVKKVDPGVSWGSVHWQYLEDMSKVTPHEGMPLQLKKALYVKETTKQGQVLKPVTGPLAVGDELVVRIELRTDRDMEYVHLKDQRGSGTEPVNVLSQYKYQDGLAYYESTRDTSSHFFIDYLPKGVYVFEYSTRVQLRGNYQSGIAEIQCIYAPEFNSHSESFALEVK
jgi:uncharacterized protein YfaS (alpha-2-macroglobulin family)